MLAPGAKDFYTHGETFKIILLWWKKLFLCTVCHFALRGKDSDVNHPRFPSLWDWITLGEPVGMKEAAFGSISTQFPLYLNEIIRY